MIKLYSMSKQLQTEQLFCSQVSKTAAKIGINCTIKTNHYKGVYQHDDAKGTDTRYVKLRKNNREFVAKYLKSDGNNVPTFHMLQRAIIKFCGENPKAPIAWIKPGEFYNPVEYYSINARNSDEIRITCNNAVPSNNVCSQVTLNNTHSSSLSLYYRGADVYIIPQTNSGNDDISLAIKYTISDPINIEDFASNFNCSINSANHIPIPIEFADDMITFYNEQFIGGSK